MTEENLRKLHKHLSFLSEGKFTELDFRKEYGGDGEDIGRTLTGKMTAERRQLIREDAQRHLKNLERKHPFLIQPEVKEEPKEEKKETKSKGKK